MDVPVAVVDNCYKVVRHSNSGMELLVAAADYPSESVVVVELLLMWDRGVVTDTVGVAGAERDIVGWLWAVVGRQEKSGSRYLVKVVEEVRIQDGRGSAVLRANRRPKFLTLEDVHMLIEDDGAGTDRVPKKVAVVVVAEMAGRRLESGCVDSVIETFVDRGAKDLLHKILGQWVEGYENLEKSVTVQRCIDV